MSRLRLRLLGRLAAVLAVTLFLINASAAPVSAASGAQSASGAVTFRPNFHFSEDLARGSEEFGRSRAVVNLFPILMVLLVVGGIAMVVYAIWESASGSG